jgi:hypothetical protein
MTVAARVGNGIIAKETAIGGRGAKGWRLLPAWNRPRQQVRSFAYHRPFCELQGAGLILGIRLSGSLPASGAREEGAKNCVPHGELQNCAELA